MGLVYKQALLPTYLGRGRPMCLP